MPHASAWTHSDDLFAKADPAPGDVAPVQTLFQRYLVDVVGTRTDGDRICAWDPCNEPLMGRFVHDANSPVRAAELRWLTWCRGVHRARGRAVLDGGQLCGGRSTATHRADQRRAQLPPGLDPDRHGDQSQVHTAEAFETLLDTCVHVAKATGKELFASETVWSARDDADHAEVMRYTLGHLAGRGIGFAVHALHHNLVADLHRDTYGPVGHPSGCTSSTPTARSGPGTRRTTSSAPVRSRTGPVRACCRRPARPIRRRTMTWSTHDLARALGQVMVPGSPVTGVERLTAALPPLVEALAAHGLDQDPAQWIPEQVARVVPSLLDAAGPGGDAGRALLDRAGSSYFADEASWPALGYRVLQPGVSWPAAAQSTPRTILLLDAGEAYDVVIIGAGAGGGTAAHVLTELGLRVLLVERGPVISPLDLPLDHERNARVSTGLPHQLDFPEGQNPRVIVDVDRRQRLVDSTEPGWLANASAVGGGTLVYGAQAWRFTPEDFRMGSRYGSGFVDWPIDYEDLEPYYERVEQSAGVCGPDGPRTWDGRRRSGYPMPPMADTLGTAVLRRGAAQLGLETAPPPLLINSRPFGGRPACVRCGNCVGFSCHANAKNGAAVPFVPLAVATGRCDLLPDTIALRMEDRTPGGAQVVLRSGPVERTIRARHVIVAAGAVETARFLLLSGVGSATDQVGRYLQAHPYTGAVGVFDDVVQDGVGPGPSISATRFRHGNSSVVGGGILVDDFVQTPVESWHKLVSAGLVARWGQDSIDGMRRLAGRTIHLSGPLQQTPVAESRVTLAKDHRDHLGLPVAALHAIDLPAEDGATARFLADRAAEWLVASGARSVTQTLPRSENSVWAGQHQAGTARMGTDPRSSVTDERGRVWGHPAVSVADGSLHVTNGGVNPVLTIMALAWRVADSVAADLS